MTMPRPIAYKVLADAQFPTTPKPQHQRFMAQAAPEHRGDCWRTAIAILLGLDRDDVPNFIEADYWVGATEEWLAERGWLWRDVPIASFLTGAARMPDHGWVIVNGVTRRSADHWRSEQPWALHFRTLTANAPSGTGLIHHSVVMRHDLGEFIDPHPDASGIHAPTEVSLIYRDEAMA